MYRKATALIATCLMILSALPALAAAAEVSPAAPTAPAGPRGTTPNNDSEPNNDFGNATQIIGSTSFNGKVGQGDFDYFKINLQSGATADKLTVTFKANTGGGSRLTLYDPNRFEFLFEDPGLDRSLTFTAFITGYYYIYLPEMGPCDYTLTTTLGTAAFTSDNDNAPAQATAISPTSGTPYTTSGAANNDSDPSDFFKVRLDYSEMVSTDVLKAFLDAPPTGAFSILLYASGQTEPLAGYTMPDLGKNQTLTFSPTVSGDYYLRMWAHHGSGQYSLKVSLFTGMADNNGMKEFASALDKTGAHWYNTTGDLTLGIDPDDFLLIGGAVAGQVFNCTVTSTGYDAQDKTPNIQIRIHDDLNELPPTKPLADPTAYANTRLIEAGNFYVQLNLTEWAGAYDLTVFTNSPPEVQMSVPNITLSENGTDTSIQLINVFTDPEDDPLTYTLVPSIEGWQDNMTITIGNDALRTVTITPKAGWRGVFMMDITATDPYGETVTTTVQQVWVFGINHKPGIINSSIDPIIINKNGVDTDSLNMTNVFQDPDVGDQLIYNVTGNDNIRVSFMLDPVNHIYNIGPVTFVPNVGFVGTEIMYITATDNGNPPMTSDPVMVTVEVRENINEKLTVTNPPDLVMDEDSPGVTINLASNVSSNFAGDTFTFEYVSVSGNFTASIKGSLVNITPRDEFFGQEILTFNVTCSHGLKGIMKLTVVARWVNELPIVTPVSPANWTLSVSEGETVPFKINVTDEETPASQIKVRWLVNGVNLASGLEYSFATDYDTVKTSEGSKLFIIRATVNDSVTIVSVSWNLTVINVNRAPSPADVRVSFPPEGSTFDEGAKIHFIGLGSDPDGDALTFQWYEGTKLLGTGADFNTTKLSPGKHNITLKVSDATSSTSYYIIVKVNAKPTPGFEAVYVVAAFAVVAVAAVLVVRRRKD